MKIIEFKKYENVPEERQLNKKKVGIAIGILSILLILLIIFGIYAVNSNFRNFMDKYILRKSVSENSLPYVEVENIQNVHIFAYDKYVAILDKNKFKQYNSSGTEVGELEINISNPLTAINGKHILIAEKEKQKIYLIQGTKIVWEKDIEGVISRVCVNKNGYSSIVVSGTTYKSVIITYDNTGKEIFRTYLSTTIATDISISDDNKYMSFAEVDTSGTLVQYKIKTISIEAAKQSPDKSFAHIYDMELDQLVVNIEYQDKGKLIAMCNDGVWKLENGSKQKIVDYISGVSKITFSGIELDGYAFRIEEIIYGQLDQASNVEITNITSKRTNLYTLKGVAKEVCCRDNIIAVNIGTEVYFIKTNGWLAKKYVSTQEVKSVVVSGNIAGIIYRDKIEFLGL